MTTIVYNHEDREIAVDSRMMMGSWNRWENKSV